MRQAIWIVFGVVSTVLMAFFIYLSLLASGLTKIDVPLLPEFPYRTLVSGSYEHIETGEIFSAVDLWKPVRLHTSKVNKVIRDLNAQTRSANRVAVGGYAIGALGSLLAALGSLLTAGRKSASRRAAGIGLRRSG